MNYLALADTVAAQIASGHLRPGERLWPQRRFARHYGIASSTAARVYGELVRRGLAIGEVGRGTFVRSAPPGRDPALAEPGGARVDLELNFPVLPEQPALLAQSIARLIRPEAFGAALAPVGVTGTASARTATAELLADDGWVPDPNRILFAGNGRQAIAAAIAALVPVGERLGVEAITYPVVKGIAARLGVTLVPIAMDEHGLDPNALKSAHRATPLRAVYLQPALHNPLGITMPEARHQALAEELRELDLCAIEDAIYRFLHDAPPLAATAPQHTVLVDSLSKRLAPGLTLGFAVTPPSGTDRIAAALRSGAWAASRFSLAVATRWMIDGTAATIGLAKRRDAQTRQRIVSERLAGFTVHADPCSYHCWWELPGPWRAETFVSAAARHGIAITPAAAFAIGAGRAPHAVRLALASPAADTLADALDVLASLARGSPDDDGVD